MEKSRSGNQFWKKEEFEYDFSNPRSFVFAGEFLPYNIVSIQLDWSGLDAIDATFKAQQRNGDTFSWNDIPDLDQLLDSASGSVILEHIEFGGKSLNIDISKGTVTTGKLKVAIIAKRK